jgi:two-component system LytT family sensor kinase
LQPLVENAVRHGIAHRVDGGELWVTVHRVRGGEGGDRLRLCVENECDPQRQRILGRGQDPRRKSGAGGFGLTNVQRRLRLVHGDQATLTVRDSGHQFRVTVELPAVDTPVDAPANAAPEAEAAP